MAIMLEKPVLDAPTAPVDFDPHRKHTAGDESPKNDSTSSFTPEDSQRSDEIVWRYLTFESDLPAPAYLSQQQQLPEPTCEKDSRLQPPPQCPDLSQFESPFLWSDTRKQLMTWLSCIATSLTAYNAGAYSLGIDQMEQEWHVSRVALLVGITTFTCGFAIAPMVLAPFSEITGRRPVFVVTGFLFVVFQVLCAVTPTYGGMLVGRFLAGCASSTFSTMVGGVLSDIYHAKDRNFGMTLFACGALFGTGLGPVISGFVAQHTTWRWIFYLQIIVDGVVMVFIIFFFRETRGSVLLSRKARALNNWYDQLESAHYRGMILPPSTTPQRLRWKCKADEERASIATMIKISLTRPFGMLLTEPVVFFFSLWISFSWAVLYMTFSAVPLIFQTTYHFSLSQSGAVFASICVASILFTFVCIFQEKLGLRYLPPKQRALLGTPEGRLYFACVESALLPIGCLWFGISGAYPGCPWIVPALGVGCATMGIFSIYLAVFNYLADAYHRYASSALAAQSFCRNILGGAFPLFTTQMFSTMTFQGAGGFLGGLGLLLTIVPWVLLLYGPQIRAKSRMASEIMTKE